MSLKSSPDRPSGGPLTRIAVSGAIWSGLSLLLAQGLRLAALAFLARTLTAADYGVVSMALVVTGLMMLVNELGLVAAIVQRSDLSDDHLITAFWVSMATGLILTIVGVSVAPVAAWYFRNEVVAPVLAVLSIGFVFGAAGLSHRALLQRRMDFRGLAYTEIGAEVVFIVVAAGLALFGARMGAFVGALLARSLGQTVLLWMVESWRPKARFDRRCLGDILGFGANVMGAGVANYARSNVDYLVVGRRLGDGPLGHYTMAYQLTTLPVARIAGVVTRVAFPAFSEVQDDLPRLRRGYLRAVSMIAVVTMPLILGLAVLADPFVAVVLGDKWAPVAQLVRILAIAVVVKSFSTATGSVLKARGRPELAFRWSTLMLLVTAVAVVIGARYGTVGVAAAVSATTVLSAPVVHGMTNRVIDLSWRRLGAALAPATVGSIVMSAVVLSASKALESWVGAGDLALLLIGIPAGGVAYLLTLVITSRPTVVEIIEMIQAQLTSVGPLR
jgi:PST family polysaccharide transporter